MRIFPLIVPSLWLAACATPPAGNAPVPDASPVSVRAERLASRALPIVQEAVGTVEARTRATIAAQVMGTVRQVHVEAGQAVRAGQVLVTLEARELQTALAQAEAARAEALSQEPEVDKAIAAAHVALDLAETSHRRIAELFAKKSVSPQEMDDSLGRVRAAQASLELAQSKRGQTRARAETASQAIASAKVLSGYTTISAPFDGVVVEKVAQAGSLASPGAPLLILERASGYDLVVAAAESAALRLHQPLTIVWEDGSETQTKVTELVPAVDPGTRTQTAKAALPPLPGLRSGRFGRARWTTGQRSALTIPSSALLQHGQLQFALVVEDSHLRSRMISAGDDSGGRREVLTGLHPGDLVVIQPPIEWKDGAAARPEVAR